jgi:hypothetical protein
MDKIFKISSILVLSIFISCGDDGAEEVQWENDPLIGGTDIVENGIRWYVSNIEDSQGNWCGDGSYCDEKLIDEANLDRYFRFKKDGTLEARGFMGFDSTFIDYNGDAYWDYDYIWEDVIGSWKTLDGKININLSNFTNKTNITDYFFGDREYQYTTDVNNGNLFIFDDQTEISLRVSSSDY